MASSMFSLNTTIDIRMASYHVFLEDENTLISCERTTLSSSHRSHDRYYPYNAFKQEQVHEMIYGGEFVQEYKRLICEWPLTMFS